MIYTFYSYKGGVGRSMALANIAECFREKHLRVLMVDWDLEAPGLEAYFLSTPNGVPAGRLEESRRHLGLIDLLSEYKKAFPRFVEQRTAAPPAAAAAAPFGTNAEQSGHAPEELARGGDALAATLKSIEIPEFLRNSALQTVASRMEAKPQAPAQELPAFLDSLYGGSLNPLGIAPELAHSPLARYIQRVHDSEGLYLL